MDEEGQHSRALVPAMRNAARPYLTSHGTNERENYFLIARFETGLIVGYIDAVFFIVIIIIIISAVAVAVVVVIIVVVVAVSS